MHKTLSTGILASLLGALGSPLALAAQDDAFSTSGGFDPKSGEALFTHICQGCHMPDAKGAQGAGAYPALAGNPRIAAKEYPIYVVSHGQGGMPSFKGYLDDAQIASVVNYVRSHFGNNYSDKATEQDVRAISQR